MKAKPILFSGPMVRALIEGRKTMTRRIVKPQPDHGVDTWYGDAVECWTNGPCALCRTNGKDDEEEWHGPYGKPGDLLYVREKFAMPTPGVIVYASHAVKDDSGEREGFWVEGGRAGEIFIPGKPKWKPGIHMPRSASRLTLRITDVRVERVQEISEEDARSEGADPLLVPPDGGSCPHVEGFRDLWNSIHGPDAWDRNSWVLVIRFDVIQENVDQVIRA